MRGRMREASIDGGNEWLKKKDGGVERWGETDLLVGERRRESVIMKGRGRKHVGCFSRMWRMCQERIAETETERET